MLLGLLLLPLMAMAAPADNLTYAVMMDAGSTGSRVHVYVLERVADSSVPNVLDDHFLEVKPGISSYKHDPSQAGPSLQKLLDFANDHVPPTRRRATTIHLKATAGLRLLPIETQDALLESVRDTLTETEFRFERPWVSVISGVEEAVGAWITVNYLLGRLEEGAETVGIADLGGGSVQVAALPKTPPPPELTHHVTVGGKSFGLYVKSHLGYGLMQARKGMKALAKLFFSRKRSADAGQIESLEDELHVANPCFPRQHAFGHEGDQHVGAGSFAECHTLAHEWMHKGGTEEPLLSVPHIDTDAHFLGFSYIFDVLPAFGLAKEGEYPSLREIELKAEEVCAMSLKEIADKYGHHTNDADFTEHACADLTYIASLVRHMMRLEMDEKRMFLGKKINGKELSWTLGATLAVLGEMEEIDAADEKKRKFVLVGMVAVLIGVVVAIVFCSSSPKAATAAGSKKKSQKRE